MRWLAGVTLVWGLAMTLWLPWLDFAKSYRGVIADMQRARPAGAKAPRYPATRVKSGRDPAAESF